MPAAVVINDEWEVALCLPWARRFACAVDRTLVVFVLVERKEGKSSVVELTVGTGARPSSAVSQAVIDFLARDEQVASTASEEDDAESVEDAGSSAAVTVRVVELIGRDHAENVLAQIDTPANWLLILPRHATERGLDPETEWERALFLHAPCETLQLRPRPAEENEPRDILVAADGNPPSVAALRLAKRLSDELQVGVTALYVEPDVGELASDVGARIVAAFIRRAIGVSERVSAKVIVASSVKQAIADAATNDYGMLLLGANRRGIGRRLPRSSISESLMARREGPAVAVIRPAIPLASRLTRFASGVMKARIPQLEREQRVSLVERIQGSSQWNFDFISLVCLSTLIAAIGLMQDSPAVVIGAMLVAPLMTPLVGAGLSLVQGNRALIQRTSSTVFYGFLLALVIALLVGWLVPNLEETHEMLARGSPRVLDFVVALVSGIAAAYAMGRPNLFSALPGVAIAAALIPPVATAGLAASVGNLTLAAGALLLFVTNIVAIVLGTAAALWVVGIRATHQHGLVPPWVFRLSGALVLLALLIAVYEVIPHHALPRELDEQIQSELEKLPEAELLKATRTSPRRLQLVIGSNQPIDDSITGNIGRAARQLLGDDLSVQIETRLQTTAPGQPDR